MKKTRWTLVNAGKKIKGQESWQTGRQPLSKLRRAGWRAVRREEGRAEDRGGGGLGLGRELEGGLVAGLGGEQGEGADRGQWGQGRD